MDELIKKLTEERDEWRDKFHALNQTAGELCNACGWAFKIPGESCRCEVIKERDEARAEVERLRAEAAPMNEHFTAGYRDGYRDAYRRGAEAMREHIAEVSRRNAALEWFVELVRALPIPEEP